MGQIWTKNKPDKAGWYWAMIDNVAKIVRVQEYDYYGNNKLELCCFLAGDDEPFRLSKVPSDVYWGSGNIPEPQSVKY